MKPPKSCSSRNRRRSLCASLKFSIAWSVSRTAFLAKWDDNPLPKSPASRRITMLGNTALRSHRSTDGRILIGTVLSTLIFTDESLKRGREYIPGRVLPNYDCRKNRSQSKVGPFRGVRTITPNLHEVQPL